MSHSINIRDIIAARAEACVQHPPLVFDYDHQNNCEAFANLLTGAADIDSGDPYQYLGESSNKNRTFYGQADRKR